MLRASTLLIASCVFVLASSAFGASSLSEEEFNKNFETYQELAKAGQWRQSLRYAKRIFDAGRELYGEESQNYAALSLNYGNNLAKIGNNDLAHTVLLSTLELYEKIYGEDTVECIPVYIALGRNKGISLQSVAAAKQFNRALKIGKEVYGKNSEDYAQLSLDIGESLLQDARSKKAKKHLEFAYDYFSENLGKESTKTAYATLMLGKFEMSEADYRNAIKYFEEALEIYGDPELPKERIELTIHALLVQAYENIGNSDSATTHSLAIGRVSQFSASQEPTPLAYFMPKYPSAAAGKEGKVTVRFTIDEAGFVRNPNIVETQGSSYFEIEVLKVIEKFRFAPRFVDGKPVATDNAKYVFSFQLTR